MLWQLLLLAAALGAAYYRWSRRRLYRLARELPSGLKEYPLVGHGHMFLGSSEDRINTLKEMGRTANKQGGLTSVWLSHRLYVGESQYLMILSVDIQRGRLVRFQVVPTYAMLSMKTALANLVRRYRLLPPAGMAAADYTKPLRVEYSIMMKAVDNFVVRIEERNK